MPRLAFAGCLAAVLLVVRPSFADEPEVDLGDYYGFGPLEMFKLEDRSQSMLAGELSGDDRTDLVLVDNSHSRLDLLVQRAEPDENAQEASDADDVNRLENAWRFEHRKLSVDREVAALALGDLNGDGRTDIIYLGNPDELVVRYQPEKDSTIWSERYEVRLPEATQSAWTVATGDLNGDERTDVAVLGKTTTYVLHQNKDGKLEPPKRLMNTSEDLGLLQIGDFDGDGRADLGYTADAAGERTLCVRRQDNGGELGPELQFELSRQRSLSVGQVRPDAAKEFLTVDAQTDRVKLWQLQKTDDEDEDAGRLIHYGFGDASADRDRDLCTTDLDGDGRTDVVVTSPSTARILVYRQREAGGLGLAEEFPGLTGVTQVRALERAKDEPADLLVLSPKEKTLGVCRFAGGRLTFPEALPVPGEPVAMELADLDGDGQAELFCIVKEEGGDGYAWLTMRRTGDDWIAVKPDDATLELSGRPERLLKLDVNQDGRSDFLAFFSLGRLPSLLVTDKDGRPEVVEPGGGIQLGDVSAGAVFVDRSGERNERNERDQRGQRDALLVARDGFARRLALDDQNRWTVEDQYNAAEPGAEIEGVAALDWDGEPGEEIVLVDGGINRLRLLRREDGVYRPWQEIETGQFPFLGTRAADLDGDGREDLLLFGRSRLAVLYSRGAGYRLEELASHESQLEKSSFADAVAGDLNADGRADVAAMDVRSHNVEILAYDEAHGLRHALHFPVFEAKSFTGQDAGVNPREALIADVTGDGRSDLVLLAHDRVLVYPQDAGPHPEPTAAQE